jgi:sugar lactone lactonase YvrE
MSGPHKPVRQKKENLLMRNRIYLMALASVMLVGCGGTPPQKDAPPAATAVSSAPSLPATISAKRGGFIPEGVEYDTKNKRLLTGSLAEGTIFQWQADGNLTPLVTDADLKSSVGIEADEERDRLLVCNSDAAVFQGKVAGQAKLGIYNLTTGAKIAMVDLAATDTGAAKDAKHFANDVAVGSDGSAYVTDTQTNVVYRVGPDNVASVLYRFPATKGLALNGIVFHPSGYLLVTGGANLYKMPISNPAGVTEVKLPEELPGQDGMLWAADGRLVVVSNSQNRMVGLKSSDDWATAQLAGEVKFAIQGTTAAAVGNDFYVVHPHFMDADPPSVERLTLP